MNHRALASCFALLGCKSRQVDTSGSCQLVLGFKFHIQYKLCHKDLDKFAENIKLHFIFTRSISVKGRQGDQLDFIINQRYFVQLFLSFIEFFISNRFR